MRRMTGGREEILAAVSFLSVQVRVDVTIADTEGSVLEKSHQNKPYDEILGAAQFTECTMHQCQKLS